MPRQERNFLFCPKTTINNLPHLSFLLKNINLSFLGLPLKDIQTERHLYHCMALTANALSFSWSRWNLLSGYDKLIMQFREKVPGHQESPLQVKIYFIFNAYTLP